MFARKNTQSRSSFAGFLFLLLSIWSGCGQAAEEEQQTITIDTEDAVVQRIINLATRRETVSLLPFLVVDNAMHRYTAALCLGSVQDSTALTELGNALYDDHESVRRAAAFALGQSGKTEAAKFLVDAFKSDTVRGVRAAILEAVGRCGDTSHLKFMSTTHPYPSKDTLLLEGQIRGLYHFAVRGMAYEEGVRKVIVEFISNPLLPGSVRRIAAAYLARAKSVNLSAYEPILIDNLQKETDIYTRRYLTEAASRLKTPTALNALRGVYAQTQDYGMRCQILRSFSQFAYDSVRTLVFEALQDTNSSVQLTAADYLISKGIDRDALIYSGLGDAHSEWAVAVKLQQAALNALAYYRSPNKQFISQKLKTRYAASTRLYEKAAILTALGEYSGNYRFVAEQIFPRSDTSAPINPVLRSAGAQALVDMRNSPTLAQEWGLSQTRALDELNALLVRLVEEGDGATAAVVAQSIAEQPEAYRKSFPEWQFLEEALRRQVLPRDIETAILLTQAISALSGKAANPPKAAVSNFVEIDWQLLNLLKTNPFVVLKTNKGDIKLRLFPEQCPATVSQFVQLVKSGFYTNRIWHRVVPNFVVQTGCSRGDGWGGLDVVAPSEFSDVLRFDAEGMVGMASAGKDTEGSQFFITHAPTLHLQGRYTLFGQVAEGMTAVHKLQVGDTLLSASLVQ